MATHINYTQAERASFELVPETCPAVEKAIDDAFRTPMVHEDFAIEVFAKYGVVPDKATRDAMLELMGRILFMRKVRLAEVVLYQGTFPLRAALVRQVEQARGMAPGRNHFEEWIAEHDSRKKYMKPPEKMEC